MSIPGKLRDPATLRPATQLVHGASMRSQFAETSEALFLTQGYLYDTMEEAEARFKGDKPGFIYSRFANPTVAMFERRMALLEGAESARATASGMAAVTAALMGQLKAGDHIVAARALFGSCLYVVEELLPRFGVESTLVDGADLPAWRAAMRDNTKTTFLESPTNPTLELVDIAEVAKIAHERGATLVVDNVFATPLLQKPLRLGADCVVYSATKHIDGQGRTLGGVILASEQFIATHIHNFLRQTGPCLSPFNAWVMLKSLENSIHSRCRTASERYAHRGLSRRTKSGEAGRTFGQESTLSHFLSGEKVRDCHKRYTCCAATRMIESRAIFFFSGVEPRRARTGLAQFLSMVDDELFGGENDAAACGPRPRTCFVAE